MANSAQIAIPIGATATSLIPSHTVADASLNGDTLVIQNTGTVVVYVGGTAVSTSIGFPLAVGATMVLDVAEDLFGVVSGSTAGAVAVLRVK